MQFPPFPRYLVPPRSKYSPQHHVLKHPQLPFLPQCQRPSFTPIQNNRPKLEFYISWSLHFWIATWKTKDSAPNDSKQTYTNFQSYLTQFLLKWQIFKIKVVEKLKTHILFSITFFFLKKSCLLWDTVENLCRVGHATDDNMAHAHCMQGT